MFITTLLLFTLFVHETIGGNGCFFTWPVGSVDPEPGWNKTHGETFDKLGTQNYSISASHLLHGLTVEAAMTFFNLKFSSQSGIPGMNPDLSADDSNAIIPNLPSRANGYSSSGLYGFVDYMDHITDPNWVLRGSNLERILHAFHMQELWAAARTAADGFGGVSEETCKGALDHENNGIDKAITAIFKFLKYTYRNPNNTLPDPGVPDIPLEFDVNGESWKLWRASLMFPEVGSGTLKSMGLYVHCLMRTFHPTEQAIEMDGCCDSKKVGDYSYTLVFTGKTLTNCKNNCIYTRDDKPGSNYCFAEGEQKVHCLD